MSEVVEKLEKPEKAQKTEKAERKRLILVTGKEDGYRKGDS